MIIALESSRSFATTHAVIKEMSGITDWSSEEKESLADIALKNGQVFSILRDMDVQLFYKSILSKILTLSDNEKKIKAEVEKEE